MNTTMKTLSALAITTAALATTLASPALAGRDITSARSVGHINIAVGRSSFTTPPPSSHAHRLRDLQGGRVPMPKCPDGCIRTNVGEGDTIDSIPWGGHPGNGYQPGDGSWGTVNNGLPGKGAMGN
jgi:hypothetical protein